MDQEDNERMIRKIHVSKLALSKRSGFFDNLFREQREEKVFKFPIRKSQAIWMELLLQFIYTNEFSFLQLDVLNHKQTNTNQYQYGNLMIYELALLFDVPDIFTNFPTQSTEALSYIYNFIEQKEGEIGVGNYKRKPRTWKASESFYKKAGEIIKEKFRNINDILENKKEFVALTVRAVKEILENPLFQTDSENSVFTIIMIWINKDLKELKVTENASSKESKRQREIYFTELLPLVDLSRISPYFLLSIVANAIEEILSPEIKQFATERYVKALEVSLGKTEIPGTLLKHLERPRTPCGSTADKFAMRVEFRRISEWKEGEKYYSQPIFSNGFLFYFFMRVEKSEYNSYLAGYLRCTCDATFKSNYHYMPVTVTFEVILKNGKTRKFPAVSVIFDHFDRSIGSRMNHPSDDWEKIRTGLSDIVKDEKIIVIIGVEFKRNI